MHTYIYTYIFLIEICIRVISNPSPTPLQHSPMRYDFSWPFRSCSVCLECGGKQRGVCKMKHECNHAFSFSLSLALSLCLFFSPLYVRDSLSLAC